MVEGFKKWLREQDMAEGTVKSYAQNMEQYMRWYRESYGEEMTVLIRSNVLNYRSYLQNVKRLKAVTVNNKLSTLISFDLFLIETGYQSESAV